ncbi:MAG: ABC transporter permease [Anaerolineae bacterium]|nr:ABC transporter permease [Anaerolineae bacterium]
MRYLWIIAQYDLLRSLKDRTTFLIGLLMPALMMFILGRAMTQGQPTVEIDLIDRDGSALSRQFVALLEDEITAANTESGSSSDGPAFLLCAYHADSVPDDCDLDGDLSDRPGDWDSTADKRLEDTEAYGTIIIEPGFAAALRAGETVEVLFKRSDTLSAPTLATQKIDAAISRMGGTIAITNLVLRVAEESYGDSFAELDRTAAFDDVLAGVESAWTDRPVEVRAESTKGSSASLNGFNQSGPGIAVMFVLMFMLNAATVLVYERETGTLQRLYSLPVRRALILGGKILGQYLYGLLIFVVLIVVGALMGVEWGRDIVSIALIVLVFTLTATALGVALATVVRTSAQASSVSMFMGLTLAPIGGAWWPLEIVPDFMKMIGHISPIAWAMDAFQELMWYNGTLTDILPMLGVLLGMAAVFFAFGVWRFKYE